MALPTEYLLQIQPSEYNTRRSGYTKLYDPDFVLTEFFEVILVGVQLYELYCFVVLKSDHINRRLLPQHRQLYHLQSYHWERYMSFESHPPADA